MTCMYLPIGRDTSQDSLEYLKFPGFVLNVNPKSTGIESKNVDGKDDIKLYPSGLFCPTRSSSLSHWLNSWSSKNNLLIFAIAVKPCIYVAVICTYLQFVCVNLRRLGSFDVLSFRLIMLTSSLRGITNQLKLKVKICKYSVMQITGYNLNDLWSRDVWITKNVNKASQLPTLFQHFETIP